MKQCLIRRYEKDTKMKHHFEKSIRNNCFLVYQYLNYIKQISMSGFLGNTSMFLMGIGLVPLSLVQLKVDALYLSISVAQCIVVSTEIWSKILLCACSFTLKPSENNIKATFHVNEHMS